MSADTGEPKAIVNQAARQANAGKPRMKVKVYSPFRDYYDGEAFSVSAANATGPFDVLPRHHNFISLLTASEIIIQPVHEHMQRIIISGGLMHVKADQVIVFLDI
ncbi:MAG TPA: hypothetical protein VMU97_01865 [Candidatus Dormibacteraeota bacterium]|nr:hypothetical protein [Candidatus Dormibacteraeota bacterium]